MRACFLAALIAMGCGGKVVVDDGTGAAGPSSGTGASTVSSSSSGTPMCTGIADCTECVTSCAAPGPCAALYDAAMSNPDASAFQDCFFAAQCGSAPDWLTCTNACAADHPSGHASLLAYYRCIECDNCPTCQEAGWSKYYGC